MTRSLNLITPLLRNPPSFLICILKNLRGTVTWIDGQIEEKIYLDI